MDQLWYAVGVGVLTAALSHIAIDKLSGMKRLEEKMEVFRRGVYEKLGTIDKHIVHLDGCVKSMDKRLERVENKVLNGD